MSSIGILYLSGRINSENANELEVSIESFICLFVLVYCDIELDVYIVDTQDVYPCTVPLQVLRKLNNHFERNIAPKHICDCLLPAVEACEKIVYVAGLCAVLRWIIKLYAEIYPDHHSKSLLGFRGGCLVACTESSVWTKFCELQLPDAVREVATSIRNGLECEKIPFNLAILEEHLNQPVRTHNILKRKLDIAKKVMQSHSNTHDVDNTRDVDKAPPDAVAEDNFNFTLHKSSTSEDNDDILDIPEQLKNMTITEKSENFRLNHCYLEGIDLTLADMIVFPCVHYLLHNLPSQAVNLLKNVSKWYHNMNNNVRVKNAAFKCYSSYCSITEKITNTEIIDKNIVLPKVTQVTLYTRDPSRTKLRSKKYNPARILSILKAAEIHPSYGLNCCQQLEWDSLPAILHPANGDLPEKRVGRKCQQLESIVTAILKVAKSGQTIVEFCAGGGHVGLLLAYYLPNCKIILVENKESSMMRARNRAQALGLTNISFFQCNMDYFKGSFDIGVSLHACGVATDLVIQQCLSQKAAFVCCPCCYGGVQDTHLLKYPLSERFRCSKLSYQDYTLLAHCADRNEVNTPTASQGELCMGLIDMDRVFNAEEHGYDAVLTTLQPPSCSPKHNLLIATPLTWNKSSS